MSGPNSLGIDKELGRGFVNVRPTLTPPNLGKSGPNSPDPMERMSRPNTTRSKGGVLKGSGANAPILVKSGPNSPQSGKVGP